MIYLARFRDPLPPLIIDDPEGVEHATARIEEETGERPVTLQEMPPGLLFVEVRFADEDGSREAEGAAETQVNPANVSELGVLLEPFELFAEWLEAVDDQDLDVILAATVPAEQPDGG